VNTGLGALFILAALAMLGGDSLTNFAVALLIGIIAGTLSSALVAVPLAIELEKRSSTPPPQPKRRGKVSAPEGSGAVL
jgi:SecD/SecF fusion protein